MSTTKNQGKQLDIKFIAEACDHQRVSAAWNISC